MCTGGYVSNHAAVGMPAHACLCIQERLPSTVRVRAG
jgi:hypothetical protein